MTKSKTLFLLFVTMLKIGLFAFGGGYGMISLLENEFVSKRKWLGEEEFVDLITVAESTPGPIAINCSTYIGYKISKLLGAILATVAVCIPSFIIIFGISLVFNAFLANAYVAAAFKGVQVCVLFLIINAAIKTSKTLKKRVLDILVFSFTVLCSAVFALFAVDFSSVLYILISALLGLFIYTYDRVKQKLSETKNDGGQS